MSLLAAAGCGDEAAPSTALGSELQNVTSTCAPSSAAPTLAPQTISLWPPNHKLHTITVADCVQVTNACQPELTGEFIWASSDEPINGLGDGNHEPDVLFDDCGHLQVRAERAGPKDGRVYRLGVRVIDAAGHASESGCTIVVDHSKNGVVAADSGTAYRVNLDGANGTLACDGTEPAPTPAPAPAPVEAVSQPAPQPVEDSANVI